MRLTQHLDADVRALAVGAACGLAGGLLVSTMIATPLLYWIFFL